MSLQQKIDRITDILRRDDGISGAMHYTEQTSWVLFLKFLDDYESEKEDEAVLSGKDYQPVLDEEHRWSNWACPKNAAGKLDINKVRTGDDLTDYVNNELFPYLKSFANAAVTGSDPKSFAYKIGAIFQYLDNKVASGHTLREVLDIIDTLNFQSSDEMFELSLVYEGLLQNMGDAGGYAGEFYTPRPVVRAMIKAIDPQAGQTIYDAAAGSCGFLVEAFEHLKAKKNTLSTEQWDFIQRDTFFGFEKTSLAYVMGMMNMILHGIESPNLFRGNTLTQNIRDIQEKDRYDIILANPPFGGKEKSQIQQNFPIQSNATELLFLQHFMKTLKSGGKAAIVVPEGVLFQTNSAFKQVKQELLENYNLHTILSLPAGVFLPYSGVKTNVLFFERSGGTSDVWYYECEPEQKLTKNKPITDEHLKEFVELYNSRKTTDRSWTIPAIELQKGYDLSAKNPFKQIETRMLAPKEVLNKVRSIELSVSGLLDDVEKLLGNQSLILKQANQIKVADLVNVISGYAFKSGDFSSSNQIRPIKITNVGVTEFTPNDEEFLPIEYADKFKKFSVKSGDIVVALTRPIINGGFKVCRVPEAYDGALVNQRVAALSSENMQLIEYVYLYLQSPSVKQYVLDKSKSLNQPNLSIVDLKNLSVPLPESRDSLDKLVSHYKSIASKLKQVKAELYKKNELIELLNSSFFDSVFKGEL